MSDANWLHSPLLKEFPIQDARLGESPIYAHTQYRATKQGGQYAKANMGTYVPPTSQVVLRRVSKVLCYRMWNATSRLQNGTWMSTNRHHKRPRSRGGKSDKYNCVKVDADKHYFWHRLFGNMSGDEIMMEINSIWLDGRYKVVHR